MTNPSSHNNLVAWNINAGTVVLANTSGYGADRGVTINGGTLKIGGANFDLINDGQAFTMTGGVFDLNGKSEVIAAVAGSSGAVIRNGLAATTSTLIVGGGISGTTSASFAGVIENGAGTLSLTKEGSGTQTLTGINTYTGDTTVSAGAISLADNAGLKFVIGANGVNNRITGAGTVTLDGDFTFDLSGANITDGNSWNIVNVGTLALATFGSSFTVANAGFTQSSDVWTWVDGSNTWTFTEATGALGLMVVPEPGTGAMLLGALGTLLVLRRRHRPTAPRVVRR